LKSGLPTARQALYHLTHSVSPLSFFLSFLVGLGFELTGALPLYHLSHTSSRSPPTPLISHWVHNWVHNQFPKCANTQLWLKLTSLNSEAVCSLNTSHGIIFLGAFFLKSTFN
jgi:hypothetical protein